MSRHLKGFLAVICVLMLLTLSSTALTAQLLDRPERVPGVILVKFKQGEITRVEKKLDLMDIKSEYLRKVFKGSKFKSASKIFKRAVPGITMATSRTGQWVEQRDLSHWYKIEVDENTDIDSMVKLLKNDERIEKVSPSYYYYTDDTTPDDTYFGSQGGLKQGTTGRDIHAPGAWDYNTGNSNVKVAVIDTGVDVDHEDLDPGNRSRVIAGRDTGDDDNNPDDDSSSGDPAQGGHGTKVAGVIGAITDNNQGVAGIMWDVQIIPVKVKSSSTGEMSDDMIADGIDWATNNGADIINISLSSTDGTNNPMADAVWNANGQGVLVIASMGNNSSQTEVWPAGYWPVFSIGATDGDDSRRSTSNWGSHINVVAPGDEAYNYTTHRDDAYGSFSATSCAAPMTAGTAGLVLSESMDRGLNLTNDDIKHLIEVTADKVRQDLYTYDSKGWHIQMGYGRINAEEALAALQAPNSVTHGTIYGGSSSLIQGTHKHTFFNNGGLASGQYFVKTYKVTKTITFAEPYVTTPTVWIRETTSKGWSSVNPNEETNYFNITSVSTTSFTVETYIFYVQYNILGQTLNQWWPATSSNVRYDYTVLGDKFSAPSNLTASLPEPLRITLTWTDNTSGEDGFKIEKKAGSSGTWTQIATVGSNVTTYHYDDFIYSPYYFRVRAYDGGSHTAYSNETYIDPWRGYISGPSHLDFKERGTFTAYPDGATYEWRYRYNGTGSWSGVVGTSRIYYRTMIFDDFELQCKITKGGRTVYDTHYVEYGDVPW